MNVDKKFFPSRTYLIDASTLIVKPFVGESFRRWDKTEQNRTEQNKKIIKQKVKEKESESSFPLARQKVCVLI